MSTKVTIELTDIEIQELRLLHTCGTHMSVYERKTYEALPPEPVRLEIELPPKHPYGGDATWDNWAGASGEFRAGFEIGSAGAIVLNAVVAALRNKAAQQ